MIKVISKFITKKISNNELNKNSDITKDRELLNHYRSFSEERLKILKVNYQATETLYKNNQFLGIIFSFVFSMLAMFMKSAVDSNGFSLLAFLLLYFFPLTVVIIFFIRISFKLLIQSMLLGLLEIALEEKKSGKRNNNLKV